MASVAAAPPGAPAECPSCREAFTPHARRPVACPACAAEFCVPCVQKYLLGVMGEAKCMGCRRAWDVDFLRSTLPKTWLLGPYRAHREDVLLERERARLPASQVLVTNYEAAQGAKRKIAEMEEERMELLRRKEFLESRLAWDRAQVLAMKRSKYTRAYSSPDDPPAPAVPAPASDDRPRYVAPCPVGTCRGFVSTAWECGTCRARVCQHCGEPSGEGDGPPRAGAAAPHACDPAVAANHRAVLGESRACPGCAARIYRVDGCYQMWCTRCHCAFDWNDGSVLTGHVHNPHLTEWRRANPGAAPARACAEGLPSWADVDDAVHLAQTRGLLAEHAHRDLARVHSRAGRAAVRARALRREAGLYEPEEVRDADLRLRYLRRELDEPAWKRALQRREKKRERAEAVARIHETFAAAAGDLFRGAVEAGARDDARGVASWVAQVDGLCEYVDGLLQTLAARLGMAVPGLA